MQVLCAFKPPASHPSSYGWEQKAGNTLFQMLSGVGPESVHYTLFVCVSLCFCSHRCLCVMVIGIYANKAVWLILPPDWSEEQAAQGKLWLGWLHCHKHTHKCTQMQQCTHCGLATIQNLLWALHGSLVLGLLGDTNFGKRTSEINWLAQQWILQKTITEVTKDKNLVFNAAKRFFRSAVFSVAKRWIGHFPLWAVSMKLM